MQNSIPKLRQKPIISNKPGFLYEKLKTLTSFFLFCLDLELLIKM